MPPSTLCHIRVSPGTSKVLGDDPIRLTVRDKDGVVRYFKIEMSRHRLLRALQMNVNKETIHGNLQGNLVS